NYFGLDSLEVHQALDASIRYPAETLGIGMFGTRYKKNAEIKTKRRVEKDGTSITMHETPVGSVSQKNKDGYTFEKMVKHPEDIEVVKYIISQTEFFFNEGGFHLATEIMEDMGVPQSYYSRSPFMKCILNYLGFETTVIFLARHRKIMNEFLDFMEEWDDGMYEVIVDCPMKILNFGENIDGNLISPRYFKKYLIPYYNKRVKEVHDAGKFCHVHMDGALKDLLPLVKDTEFDGVEAATPEPQGDVTIQEIKKGLGDKILLDGIPATVFLPHFPESRLHDTVHEVLDTFYPNLILGVSDELPPNAEIARLPGVAKQVKEFSR
ncbi:hypothetical protein GF325_02155, partial [Candidatus Bathyarchaeota archaeon]|nr:hypothetical protein [Candidatus Bathyarchaeota archaeon]